MENKPMQKKLRRREFIANLLFAGGALSLVTLQGKIAANDPEDEGWQLPPDWNNPQPQKTPRPRPTRTPEPIVRGRVAPPLAGKPVAPPPKKKER